MYVIYHFFCLSVAEIIKIIPVCDAECQKNILIAKYKPGLSNIGATNFCIGGMDIRTNKTCTVNENVTIPGITTTQRTTRSLYSTPTVSIITSTYYKTVMAQPTVRQPVISSTTMLSSVKPSRSVYTYKNVNNITLSDKVIPAKTTIPARLGMPRTAATSNVSVTTTSLPILPVIKTVQPQIRPLSPSIIRSIITVTQPQMVIQTIAVPQPPLVITQPYVQTITVAQPQQTVSSVSTVTITISLPPSTVTKEIKMPQPPEKKTEIKKEEHIRPDIEISTPIIPTNDANKQTSQTTEHAGSSIPAPAYPYSYYPPYQGYGSTNVYYPYDQRYGYYNGYYTPTYSYTSSTTKSTDEPDKKKKKTVIKTMHKDKSDKDDCEDTDDSDSSTALNNDIERDGSSKEDKLLKKNNKMSIPETVKEKKKKFEKEIKSIAQKKKKTDGKPSSKDIAKNMIKKQYIIIDNPHDTNDEKYTSELSDGYDEYLHSDTNERQPYTNEPSSINKYIYDKIYKKLRNKKLEHKKNWLKEKSIEEALKRKYDNIIYINEQERQIRDKILRDFFDKRGIRTGPYNYKKTTGKHEVELSDSFSAVIPEKKSDRLKSNSSTNSSSDSDEIIFLSDLLE